METKVAVIENNTISTPLTIQEGEIVKAKTSALINDLPEGDVFLKVKMLIKMAYFNAGFKINGDTEVEMSDNLILMTRSFILELKSKYNIFSIEELDIIFRRGVLKEFGDYMGLSVVSFMSWVGEYYQQRQLAIFKNNDNLAKSYKEPEISDQEKEEIMIKGVHRAFAEYKEKGQYHDFGNAIYNYLDKKGLIKFTPADKQSFMASARMNLQLDTNEKIENGCRNVFERNELFKFIKQLEQNDTSIHKRIISEAKQVALNLFFLTTKSIEL